MKTGTRQIKCDRLDVSEGDDRACLFQDGHKVTLIANKLDKKTGKATDIQIRKVTVFQLAHMIRAIPEDLE